MRHGRQFIGRRSIPVYVAWRVQAKTAIGNREIRVRKSRQGDLASGQIGIVLAFNALCRRRGIFHEIRHDLRVDVHRGVLVVRMHDGILPSANRGAQGFGPDADTANLLLECSGTVERGEIGHRCLTVVDRVPAAGPCRELELHVHTGIATGAGEFTRSGERELFIPVAGHLCRRGAPVRVEGAFHVRVVDVHVNRIRPGRLRHELVGDNVGPGFR